MSIDASPKTGYVLTFEDMADRVRTLAQTLPIDERSAASAALSILDPGSPVDPERALSLVLLLLQAQARTEQRRRSNRKTDRRRRTMVGCKCSRDFRDQCAAAADRSYRSLNAWVHDVLYRELQRSQQQPIERWEDPDRSLTDLLLWGVQ